MASTPPDIYIDVPHLVSRRRKLGGALATGFMWILYSYLWAPLISLVAWLLGFEFAYNVMIRLGGLQTLYSVLAWYGTMLAAIVVVVLAWSAFNRYRFSGRDRRTAVSDVSDDQVAEFFKLPASTLSAARDAKVLRLQLGDSAAIESIDCRSDVVIDDSSEGHDDSRRYDRSG
jgi:biofilm PGA synthesis protein PgaD